MGAHEAKQAVQRKHMHKRVAGAPAHEIVAAGLVEARARARAVVRPLRRVGAVAYDVGAAAGEAQDVPASVGVCAERECWLGVERGVWVGVVGLERVLVTTTD